MSTRAVAATTLSLILLISGCNDGGSSGAPQVGANPLSAGTGGGNGGGSGSGGGNDLNSFFVSNIQPSLDFCRTCHLPGGVADTPDGRGFMLGSSANDFNNVHSAWQGLGEGVTENEILLQTSEPSQNHTGGTPWKVDSAIYSAVATLFQCWDDPLNCVLGGGSGGEIPEDAFPLLGSARGGHFWVDYCDGLVEADGKRRYDEDGNYLTSAVATPLPDSAPLPVDPRDLVRAGVSDGKAVHFNAFWRNCHAVPELVDEFPHPENCGQFRASVARGSIIMGTAPAVDASGTPYTYGQHEPYDSGQPSIYTGHKDQGRMIRPGTTFGGDAPHPLAALTAEQYNSLWVVWGLTSRPENFDELVAERYGFGQPVDRFPYPIVDPAKGIDETTKLNTTFGGSGRLPFGMLQTRLADGTYSGEVSTNCQGCHGTQVGDEFVIGAGGSLLDATVSSRDFAAMGSVAGVAIDRAGLAGRVRGTNNAQFSNITALAGVQDQDDLQDVLQNGTTGTGDTPAWWNVGRRPVKFVDAMFPGDAVRVDYALFTPLLTSKYGPLDEQNDFDTWTSDHVQDGDHYIISRKAPAYPRQIDEALAKQGAILFHNKNLWASDNVVPAPSGGNGSCASCHGAYSPRFVNDPDYLADPRMEGIASFVVPIDIIDTDRVRLETYNQGTNEGNSNTAVGYPETTPGSAERSSLSEEQNTKVEDCRVQNLPDLQKDSAGNQRPSGYAAPPLYGVWATAPYFHNGSVPTVEGVLNTAARPAIWRRVSKPAPAGQGGAVVMGFDHSLDRAYDKQALGWKYDELECGGGDFIPLLDCTPLEQSNLDFFLSEFYGGLLLGWNITNPPTLTNGDIEARKIYNTNMFSQGNGGHAFSDVLTEAERRAVIEYLKTL